MMTRLLLLIAVTALTVTTVTAQTVGVISRMDDRMSNGYTLLAPTASRLTYLLDTGGTVVNMWSSDHRPGQAAMMIPGGRLLRTGIPNERRPLAGGGVGGIVEEFDWAGNRTWLFEYVDTAYRAHHDVEYLPNGNILLLTWEPISRQEALELGRRPERLVDSALWMETIIEVQPTRPVGGTIVWRWSTRDHLVQNTNPILPNYGEAHDSIHRIDINAGENRTDWLHMNSIRYHADRDEILVSVRNLNEIWIIARSTGHIVYRWGNPFAYGRGTRNDQQLFAQHDARWIPDGYPGAGNILIFNNGIGRQQVFSTVEEIRPPLVAGVYSITPGQAFGPQQPTWRYDPGFPTDFISPNISGAVRLSNGNTLACVGVRGTLVELAADSTIVWRYINPVGASGPVAQGSPVPGGNQVFKVTRYTATSPELLGQPLRSYGKLEEGPLSTVPSDSPRTETVLASHLLTITDSMRGFRFMEAYDVLGRRLQFWNLANESPSSVVSLPFGTLLVRFER
ncbi:MAG: aryl-sulfate sulfotransferase [Candidatus Kapabacteria bacterium]|jgi:hypothetical protein|nr:aryl-sulfate sulfotransferase [Candidatus Kapabacteria bacterium]